MSVLKKYLWVDVKTVLVFCSIIRVWYCEKLFVKKYTTVEFACPFTPTTWYNDKPILIAVSRKVNSRFTSRYGISDTFNLKILNFTDADQGRYTCRGVVDETYQEHTFMVNLCSIPDTISYVLFEQNKNYSLSEKNLLCTEDKNTPYKNQITKKGIIRIFKLPMSQQNFADRNKKTESLRLMEYKCLILNADKCVISNNTFQLNMEWVSSEEILNLKKYTTELTTKVNSYTCDCSPTYAVNNSNCNYTIKMYQRNDTLYLDNFKTSTSDTFLCLIDQSNILEESIATTDFKYSDINFRQLTYTFGGMAAVLFVILLFAGAVIITLGRNKRQLAIASVPRTAERILSFEDDIQYREPVEHDYLDITDIDNTHSVEMTNYSLDTTHIPNSTYSGSVSSDYESIDSRRGNTDTDTTHEQDVVNVDSTGSSPNNSIERELHSDIHQYVNTNIMNPYEQLQNQTRDIHTYKDLNDGF